MTRATLSHNCRTLDPEEADFFYVPIYGACFVWPVLGYADGPWCEAGCSPGIGLLAEKQLAFNENACSDWTRRYYHPDKGPRPMHIMNMMLEAKHWIQRHFPYWDRRAGKDHIFLMAHDEGAW